MHSLCSWMSADTSECDLGHEREELNSPLLVEPARVECGDEYYHNIITKRQQIVSDKILIINLNIKHFGLFNVASLSSRRRCRFLREIQGTQKSPYTRTTDEENFWLITFHYIGIQTNILDEMTSCFFCSWGVTSYWTLLSVATHVRFPTSDEVISALIDGRCFLDHGWRAVNNMFSSFLCLLPCSSSCSSSQPLSQRLDEELLPTHPDHPSLQRQDPSHLSSIFIPLIIWLLVKVQTHSLFVHKTKCFGLGLNRSKLNRL